VQNTVRDNMPAVVSISDGIGFGSGVVVNEQGLILTAGHVVNGDVDEFEIFFPSGKTTIAKMLGYNLSVDAAMLQIVEPGPWPHAKLADGNTTPKIGDWVVCMGHSGGYELGRLPPVRTGRVLEYREHLLVTDAVLIGGDSGGPLFDLNGHVIGIHSSIGDSISENRHVSLATFRRDWQKMAGGTKWGALPNFASVEPEKKPSPEKPLEKGRARLGIQMEQNENAAIVETVERNSAAARVGIKPGDSVLMFDNIKIKNYRQLVELIRSKNIGDSVAIEIQRRGQTLKLQVILDEFK
jgi:serine protease Do